MAELSCRMLEDGARRGSESALVVEYLCLGADGCTTIVLPYGWDIKSKVLEEGVEPRRRE